MTLLVLFDFVCNFHRSELLGDAFKFIICVGELLQ